MQFIALLLPLLLVPVLVAWLISLGRRAASRLQTLDVSDPDIKYVVTPALPDMLSPAYRKRAQRAYKDMLQLASDECRHESPAYRKAAQSAYQDMQSLADEDTRQQQPDAQQTPVVPAIRQQSRFGHFRRFNALRRQTLTRTG